MYRPLITLVCALMGGIVATAQTSPQSAATVLTLDQCKALALENNNALRTARNNLQAARQQQREAFTSFFPQISATGFAFNATKDLVKMEMNTADLLPAQAASLLPAEVLMQLPSSFSLGMVKNGMLGSVSAVQPLFAGGQIVNGNRLAAVASSASAIELERQTNDVELTTEQRYWQVVALKEKQKTLQAIAALLQQLQSDVQTAVDAGITTRNDLLQVQLKVNEVQSQQLKLANALAISRQLLAQYIGRHGDAIDVASQAGAVPEFPLSLRHDHEAALASTPEYRLLEKNVDTHRLQYKMAVGRQMPTVAVGAGYSYNDLMDRGRALGMVFATVSVPISDWWGGSHAIKRKHLALDNARQQQEDSAQLLVIAMDHAWNNVEEAYQQLLLAQKSIEQSAENLRLNTDYYKAGTTTMSDLLDAQQLFQQANDAYVDAYIDYHTSLLKYRQCTAQ